MKMMLLQLAMLLVFYAALFWTIRYGAVIDRWAKLSSLQILDRFIPYICVAAALLPAIFSFVYLGLPIYEDDFEASIVEVSWLTFNGFPMWPDLKTGGNLYGVLYGPMTYLVYWPSFATLGPSVFASKLVGIICFLGALLLIARI